MMASAPSATASAPRVTARSSPAPRSNSLSLMSVHQPSSRGLRGAWAILPAIAFCITLLALLAGLYLTLAARGEDEALSAGRRSIAGITGSLTDHVSRGLETTDLVLLDIANRVAAGLPPWDSDLVTFRLREVPQLRALLVTDAEGRITASSVPGLQGTDLAGRHWMRRIAAGLRGLIVGDPEAGRFLAEPGRSVQETRRWTLPVARGAFRPDGSLAGTVVALLNPDYLAAIGHQTADAFEVTVRFHGLDGTLLATSAGTPDGIGLSNPQAWLFRDYLPALDAGTRYGPDSAGQLAVSAFRVTTPGLIAVEVSQDHATVLAGAWERSGDLALGFAVLGGATTLAVVLLTALGLRNARIQAAVRQEEFRRLAAEREAEVLRDERRETQRLLANLPAVTFHARLDDGGRWQYRFVGGSVEAVTGWEPQALGEFDGWPRQRDAGAEALPDFLARVLRDGSAAQEYRFAQPDGSSRWLSTVATIIGTQDGARREVVGHTRDITSLREASLRATAAGRLAALGEMATGIAHELKQPLAGMSLVAENMEFAIADGDVAALREGMQQIAGQCERAAKIIEHLRRFARGTDDKAPLEPFPVAEAVDGALTLITPALREAGIDVAVELGAAPPMVVGHRIGLEQVLVNLLSNALQVLAAAPADRTRRITLAVAAAEQDGQVALRIGDTGGGIPAPVLARLFQPFVTTKEPDKGTGLGLSICHGLVAAMGGTIEGANDGAGALFTITLPAPRDDAAARA